MDKKLQIQKAHDEGRDCGEEKCQTCCAHTEVNHNECSDCGREVGHWDYYPGDEG